MNSLDTENDDDRGTYGDVGNDDDDDDNDDDYDGDDDDDDDNDDNDDDGDDDDDDDGDNYNYAKKAPITKSFKDIRPVIFLLSKHHSIFGGTLNFVCPFRYDPTTNSPGSQARLCSTKQRPDAIFWCQKTRKTRSQATTAE